MLPKRMGTSLQNQQRVTIAIMVLALVLVFLFSSMAGRSPFLFTSAQVLSYSYILVFIIAILAGLSVFYSVGLSRKTPIKEQPTSVIPNMEREKQLSLIYNSTNDGILLLTTSDSTFRIVSANNAFLSIFKLREDEVLGKLIDEIAPETSFPLLKKNLQRSIDERMVIEWERTFEARGEKYVTEVRVTPVIGGGDRISSALLTIHDITARETAKNKQHIAESRYKNLVEQSLVGVYIIKDKKFAYVNPQLAKIFGYVPEELINESPDKVIHENSRAKVEANIRARMDGSMERIHYDAMGLCKDGSTVDLEIFCSGRLEGESNAIIGTLLNISERKKAEQERENALFNLNERVKELTTLLSISKILQSEQLSADEMLNEIAITLPAAYQFPEHAMAKISINGKHYYSQNYQRPVQSHSVTFRISKDGAGVVEMGYAISGKPINKELILPEEKDLLFIVAEMIRTFLIHKHEQTIRRKVQSEMVADRIQEQKKISRAIIGAQENERNKIGQELHDNVNQILASAKLYLSAVEKEATGEHKELLKNSHQLLVHAIEEIRGLSRTQVSPMKKLDLDQLINTLVDQLNDSTSLKTTFEYSVPPDTKIDDDLKLNIYRIIQEQINNVLKHSEATELSIEMKVEEGMLVICVKDNGKGFNPLKQGNGIGLTNMINRVESFDGRLTIKSEPGNGFILEVNLPLGISVS